MQRYPRWRYADAMSLMQCRTRTALELSKTRRSADVAEAPQSTVRTDVIRRQLDKLQRRPVCQRHRQVQEDCISLQHLEPFLMPVVSAATWLQCYLVVDTS